MVVERGRVEGLSWGMQSRQVVKLGSRRQAIEAALQGVKLENGGSAALESECIVHLGWMYQLAGDGVGCERNVIQCPPHWHPSQLTTLTWPCRLRRPAAQVPSTARGAIASADNPSRSGLSK